MTNIQYVILIKLSDSVDSYWSLSILLQDVLVFLDFVSGIHKWILFDQLVLLN